MKSKRTSSTVMWVWLVAGAIVSMSAGRASARGAAAPRYYFELHKVDATIPVNPDIKEFVRTCGGRSMRGVHRRQVVYLGDVQLRVVVQQHRPLIDRSLRP
jgi:hypothetical protein